MTEEQTEIEELKFRIKQLNHIVAATTGRIDVIHQMLVEGTPLVDNLYALKQFVVKSKSSTDTMLLRLQEGKTAIQ
jgi:hypothetical protein